MTRLVIADDHPAFVLGLRLSLAEAFDIVGTALDGEELVKVVLDTRPDAIITDVRMPKLSGIDSCIRLGGALDECAVVMLSTFNDPATIDAARRAGARAFVSKETPVEELAVIVRRLVADHDLDLVPPVSLPTLTPRECDVLRLVAQGCSNREIAQRLGIGLETVKDYCSSLYGKLDATDRLSAVSSARRLGLVDG